MEVNSRDWDRILKFITPVTESGCWIWTGSLNWAGYSQVYFNKKVWRGHRLVWEAYNGTIPNGEILIHQCDVRCCVNPSHLRISTQKGNMEDMVEKGRSNYGEKSPLSKLSTGDVECIRRKVNEGVECKEVANEFGIDRKYVYKILNGERRVKG